MEFIEDTVAIINCCMKKPWHPKIFSTSFTKAKLYQEFLLLLLLFFIIIIGLLVFQVLLLPMFHQLESLHIGITWLVYFVMLPNLAGLTVSYLGCCRCCVSLVFSRGPSWCAFQWLLLCLLWWVSPLFSYTIYSHTQSWNLHTSSSSLWPFCGYCSHLILPHFDHVPP